MTTKQYELSFVDGATTETPGESGKEAQGVREQGIVEEALSILARRQRRGAVLTCPKATKDFLRLRLAPALGAAFRCIFVDNRHRVIPVEELFVGIIDGASVRPRVIVQKAFNQGGLASAEQAVQIPPGAGP